ncbi:hypothetical protein [Nocardia mexicana]|uniref:DUF4386 domain-containing protein n=1 Tax=Nocardia mexicana TaxID=279262 RepID=A0A370H2Z3_9NOCA|nr:hypothetical protein [Nocardia mexicana]RDI50590.1 hypothetical protein DFR68_10567 [Nocardia mexicana]
MTAATTTRATPAVLAPTLAFAAFTVAYAAVNSGVPHPDASASEVLAYDTTHSGSLELGAMLMLCSAPVLAVTAIFALRLLRGRRAEVPDVAVAGGLLGAGALTASAVFAWVAAQLKDGASPELARAVADMSFVTGGPAYAVGFGLLAAGIAVPALLGGLLPRSLAWIGVVIAIAGAVSTIGLLVPGLLILLPLVRFGGLLWLVATAIVLSRR